jgi:hypothetical protein
MKIYLSPIKPEPGQERTVLVEIPVVPSPGDYVHHEASGIAGYVENIQFYWPQRGDLEIVARLTRTRLLAVEKSGALYD